MQSTLNPKPLTDQVCLVTGATSGIGKVTATALASESKALSHPASVDTIPTSAGKEDHVSMGPIAARKMASIADNTALVLAIECHVARTSRVFSRLQLYLHTPLQKNYWARAG